MKIISLFIGFGFILLAVIYVSYSKDSNPTIEQFCKNKSLVDETCKKSPQGKWCKELTKDYKACLKDIAWYNKWIHMKNCKRTSGLENCKGDCNLEMRQYHLCVKNK